MSLSPEIWTLIGLHLKPRYLARLLCVSKTINHTVDNENYWTRVAAHLVLRDCQCMELQSSFNPEPIQDDILPPIPHNLYDMLALDRGYFWSMECFVARVEEMGRTYAQRMPKEKCWDEWQVATLAEKTRMYYSTEKVSEDGVLVGDEEHISMKELTRRVVMNETSTQRAIVKKMIKFRWEIEEDITLTPKIKRHLFRKWQKLLYELDADLGYTLSMCCPTDIANIVCRF